MIIVIFEFEKSICRDDCIERLRTSCLLILRTFDSIEYRNINRFVVSITYR